MSQMRKKCNTCKEFRLMVGGKIRHKQFTCKRCLDKEEKVTIGNADEIEHSNRRTE